MAGPATVGNAGAKGDIGKGNQTQVDATFDPITVRDPLAFREPDDLRTRALLDPAELIGLAKYIGVRNSAASAERRLRAPEPLVVRLIIARMTARLMRRGRLAHRSPYVRGLHLAGSATHPGQWVSFCAISGILAADRICEELG